jgi:hypothetical protein
MAMTVTITSRLTAFLKADQSSQAPPMMLLAGHAAGAVAQRLG